MLEVFQRWRADIVKIARDLGIDVRDHHVTGAPPARIAVNSTQHLGGKRRNGLHNPPSVASRARIGKQRLETLTRALAAHLDQPQIRDSRHSRARPVALESLGEHVGDAFAIGFARHVDEVDDDDAADVAQPKLLDDFVGGLEVGLHDRLFLVALADEAAGVDVDGGERFGVVDDQVAARFELDFAVERPLDLRFNLEAVEERLGAVIERDARAQPRHVGLHELDDALVHFFVVTPEFFNIARKQVANGAQCEVEIVVEHRGRFGGLALEQNRRPQLGEKLDVVLDFAVAHAFAGGADDEAAFGRADLIDCVAQPRALLGARYAARDAEMVRHRHEDEVAAGDRNRGGQPRALGAHRLLGDLDDDFLAAAELMLDRGAATPGLRTPPAPSATTPGAPSFRRGTVGAGRCLIDDFDFAVRLPARQLTCGVALDIFVADHIGGGAEGLNCVAEVGDMEKSGLVEADIDERSLHSGQDASDFTFVDVAGETAVLAAFEVEFGEAAVFEERHARFER